VGRSPHKKGTNQKGADQIKAVRYVEQKMNQTYQKNNPETIQKMFGSIAKQYDRTNAVLSFNLHRYWNQSLIKAVQSDRPMKQYLDLCAGTGEIAFTFLSQRQTPVEAFLLDFSEEMLSCAQAKEKENPFKQHRIQYIQADAQEIPLPSNSIDCVTIAYGIRNVKNPKACVEEVLRVLRPGGSFAILELTQPDNPIMKLGHKIYLKTILPVVGKVIATNKEAYRYLCNSIQAFTPPAQLESTLKEVGFEKTAQKPLTGGIATIISGSKPEEL